MYTKQPRDMPSQKITDDEPDFNENEILHDGERRVRIKRRKYHPTKLGGVCVNAQTGHRYPIMQGSFDELKLYKIVDATSHYDKDGFRLAMKQSNSDPNILYYDSPEEYMRHMKTKVSQEQVNRWHVNKKRMFPESNECKFDKEAYLAICAEKYAEKQRSSYTPEASTQDEW